MRFGRNAGGRQRPTLLAMNRRALDRLTSFDDAIDRRSIGGATPRDLARGTLTAIVGHDRAVWIQSSGNSGPPVQLHAL
jgi:hypothetical protein